MLGSTCTGSMAFGSRAGRLDRLADGGTDTLTRVERARFDDQTVELDAL